ncbi:nitrite reductase (NO-forming) [Pseudomonas sp. LAMO17WK12:I10]|nr:nitrite reductase (NO-forming) [Pseudomonas sp. LAMO17WK12:I9]SNY47463.1 nitrite reductase (NO-forming) [Pseudomonas sp. LAMO17WK12:I10]
MSVFRSVLGACVLLGSCASSLVLAGGAEGLQRVQVELVAPPLVHPHEQVVNGPPKVVQFRMSIEEKKWSSTTRAPRSRP